MALDDRVAVVTGGAQGIGQGIALRLAAAGARIAVLDRPPATQTLSRVREVGPPARGGEGDGSDAADGLRGHERLYDGCGGPYGLCTTAGALGGTALLDPRADV